eukprot:8815459-Alexandrium_andersonii.AAC.1
MPLSTANNIPPVPSCRSGPISAVGSAGPGALLKLAGTHEAVQRGGVLARSRVSRGPAQKVA